MKKKYIYLGIYVLILLIEIYSFKNIFYKPQNVVISKPIIIQKVCSDDIKSVKITAAGDCTIGWDPRYGYATRYDKYLDDNNGDYGYYFKKVKYLFESDDLSIVNLEGQLTSSNDRVEKKFNFKAPTSYVNVLKKGNIDVVSFANNHAYDFGEKGYEETVKTLNEANVDYYGGSKYLIKEVNGIKIGFFALLDIYGRKYNECLKAINYLKEQNCDLIIASMHWGIEGDYVQATFQEKLGHYLIDNGVDLVLGAHPHLIQGIEKYNDKYILYSMGNFSFGGNQNPSDKDTFIYQQTFKFVNGKLQLDDNISIIPASVSSVKYINNYQPVVLDGSEGERVLNKILKYSKGFEYKKSA